MKTSRTFGNLWLFWFASDFLAVAVSYYTAFFFRFHSDAGHRFFTFVNTFLGVRPTAALPEKYEEFYLISAPRIVIFITLTVCVFYALRGLYSGRRFIRPRPVTANIILANVIALVIFYAYFYMRRNIFHPRSFFITVLFLNVFFTAWLRAFTGKLIVFLRRKLNYDRHKAVMIGFGKEADYINSLCEVVHPHGISVVHRLVCDAEEPFDQFLERLKKTVSNHDADMIISAEKNLSVGQIMRILEISDEFMIPVKALSEKMDVIVNQAGIPADYIHGVPLVHFDLSLQRRRMAVFKRCCSVGLVALTLPLSLPVMLLICLLVKLTSKGPVFFVQERIGVNRKPFRMLKFRTMYDRADEEQAQVEEFNESGEGLFKIRKDPRVTPVGRFLRRFSLDELPQLVNILKGQMALVGPRPLPRRDFENYYEEWHYARHGGLPGMTCLWQISGRSDLDFHNMCILDVYYLRNRNWILDLEILLRTAVVVFFAKGAY